MADPATGFDWGTWASIGIATGALGSAVTWIWSRGGKAALLAREVADAKTDAGDALKKVDNFGEDITKLREDFHEHMLKDAAAFAKLESIATEASRATIASEVRLTTAIENLGGRMDAMGRRFDDVIGLMMKGVSASRGRKT
jgi:hypothetical protein